MRKVALKPRSKKRLTQLREYVKLIAVLRVLCKNRSELSGEKPDWQSDFFVDPHHISGREGKRLLNPFKIIMLTRNEHIIETDHKKGCHTEEELYQLIKPIRIKQGYEET